MKLEENKIQFTAEKKDDIIDIKYVLFLLLKN